MVVGGFHSFNVSLIPSQQNNEIQSNYWGFRQGETSVRFWGSLCISRKQLKGSPELSSFPSPSQTGSSALILSITQILLYIGLRPRIVIGELLLLINMLPLCTITLPFSTSHISDLVSAPYLPLSTHHLSLLL